ncbi:MAG: hypothetical protein FD169_2103 [Bacillota bacterium]|nr:MAG: hypothetical protein FD169_2103 [Bacillota bacterium]
MTRKDGSEKSKSVNYDNMVNYTRIFLRFLPVNK